MKLRKDIMITENQIFHNIQFLIRIYIHLQFYNIIRFIRNCQLLADI